MQLKLELLGSKDNLTLRISSNDEKFPPVINTWLKKRKIKINSEKNIVLDDVDTITAFASMVESLPRMNTFITDRILNLAPEIKLKLSSVGLSPNQWLIDALIRLYREELDNPENLRLDLRYLRQKMFSRLKDSDPHVQLHKNILNFPVNLSPELRSLRGKIFFPEGELKNPEPKSPIKIILITREEMIINIDPTWERIELRRLLKGLGQSNADFTQISFYSVEQALDAVEILSTNVFDRLFYVHKGSYREYCLYINPQYAQLIYQAISILNPSASKEAAQPHANLFQIATRCGDVSKVGKMIKKDPKVVDSLTKGDLEALEQSNKISQEAFEQYKELPYFHTSPHDKRYLLPVKPCVPRGSYVSIISLISVINQDAIGLPPHWTEKMASVYRKAQINSNELTIQNLHKIRENIVTDKETKRFNPHYERVFSDEEEIIVLATLETLFSKNCQEILPDSAKLSSVLGLACYVTDLGKEVQIKITENPSDPDGYKIHVAKLKSLGACIVKLTRNRFSSDIISCAIEIANYSLEALNRNVEIAYQDILPALRFVSKSGGLVRADLEKNFDLATFLTFLGLDKKLQENVKFLTNEEQKISCLLFPVDYDNQKIVGIMEQLGSYGLPAKWQKSLNTWEGIQINFQKTKGELAEWLEEKTIEKTSKAVSTFRK